MRYLIDSADIAEIKRLVKFLEIKGVTTNPSIISKEKKEFSKLIKEIKEAIGERELHVQVTEETTEKMVEEGLKMAEEFGPNVYIKVPVTESGYEAIKILKRKGIKITATAIFNEHQAIMAALCGADYVAPYVNRIENLPRKSTEVIENISTGLKKMGLKTEILAASFKNLNQIGSLFFQNVDCITAAPDLLTACFLNEHTEKSCEKFIKDWKGYIERVEKEKK